MKPSGNRRPGRCGAEAPPEPRPKALRALVDGLSIAFEWLLLAGVDVGDSTNPAPREDERAQGSWLRHRDRRDLSPAKREAVGRLGRLLAKRELFSDFLVTVDRLIEALADTDRWAGQNDKEHGRRFYERLDGLLAETSSELKRGERDQLRARACIALQVRQEERDQRSDERRHTLDFKADMAAILAAAEREAHMTRIGAALSARQPVSDADLRRAIATHAELRGGP